MNKWVFVIAMMSFAVGATGQNTFTLQQLKLDSVQPTKVAKTTDTKGLAGALLKGYKWLFSSQDGSNCSFHPSCSNYAASWVHKHGLIQGLLAGFDRLVRCHAIEPQQYKHHTETGKQHDPVP